MQGLLGQLFKIQELRALGLHPGPVFGAECLGVQCLWFRGRSTYNCAAKLTCRGGTSKSALHENVTDVDADFSTGILVSF